MDDYQLPFQTELLGVVEYASREILVSGTSAGVLLIGGSGVGKTYALDLLAAAVSASTNGPQRITPCIRSSAMTSGKVSAISQTAMVQLGRPLKSPSDLKNHEVILHDALWTADTRLFLMEEFHNGLLAKTSLIRDECGRYVKNLWNLHPNHRSTGWAGRTGRDERHSMVIVISGTEPLRRAFALDEELNSRFGTIVEAPKLGLYPTSHFEAFREILRRMVRRFDLHSIIDADNDLLAVQFVMASEAHLRVLEALLRRIQSLVHGRKPGPLSEGQLLKLCSDALAGVAAERARTLDSFVLSDVEVRQLLVNAKAAYAKEQELPHKQSRRRGK